MEIKDKTLSISKVASDIGLPVRTVRHYAARGIIKAHRNGAKIWVVNESDYAMCKARLVHIASRRRSS
jgi:hypothetical protein